MSHRCRPTLPPLIPARLTDPECIVHLQHAVGWTRQQATVVLAGVGGEPYSRIAGRLGLRIGTVHVHFAKAFEWIGRSNREAATTLAVAVLWQVADE